MKKETIEFIGYKSYPAILMSSVILFLLFMIIGFIVQNETASNVLFTLSFISLIAYIPTFILLSKLQEKKWYKKYARCQSLKIAKRLNMEKIKQKAEELKKEYNIE
ncbi:MAG: hypothetical protein IJZ29_03390 [Clostridia bacterium]|nr:hypothetical protein [Clostridia bacterium]